MTVKKIIAVIVLLVLVISLGYNAATIWTRTKQQWRADGANMAVTNIMRSALQNGSITLTAGKTAIILDLRKLRDSNEPNDL
jgi:uncharacterized membrane protein